MSEETIAEEFVAPKMTLASHRLPHLNVIHVGDELFTTRYERACNTSACNAHCCRDGALIDVGHRDRILREADLVARYMDHTQPKDPALWFDDEIYEDGDYPSGHGVCTGIANDQCVFLDSEKRCTLQRAEVESPDLKPFYCRAYPITLVDSRLTIENDWCPGETHCCGPIATGERSVLDVCHFELRHVLGDDGVRELQAIAAARLAERSLPIVEREEASAER